MLANLHLDNRNEIELQLLNHRIEVALTFFELLGHSILKEYLCLTLEAYLPSNFSEYWSQQFIKNYIFVSAILQRLI